MAPILRKFFADRAMVNTGLWLNRQGPYADFAVFHNPPSGLQGSGNSPELGADDPDHAPNRPDLGADHPDQAPGHLDQAPNHLDLAPEGPEIGTDHPGIGTDHPEFGTDHPEFGADHPRIGVDRSEIGVDDPRIDVEASRTGTKGPRIGTGRPETGKDRCESGAEDPEIGADGQPPARFALYPARISSATSRSAWSPWTSNSKAGEPSAVFETLRLPPLPHIFFQAARSASASGRASTRGDTVVTVLPPRPPVSRRTRGDCSQGRRLATGSQRQGEAPQRRQASLFRAAGDSVE